MWKDKNCGILNTYTEIGNDNFTCALWTSEQQFNLKMLAICRISIVLLQSSLYCTFLDVIVRANQNTIYHSSAEVSDPYQLVL